MSAARRGFLSILFVGFMACVALARDAAATTVHPSQFSSEANPSPTLLAVTLVFMLTGPSELTLTVTNDTTAPNTYLIHAVWRNPASDDVPAAWAPIETGFGTFDFGDNVTLLGVAIRLYAPPFNESRFVITGHFNFVATPSAAPIPEPDAAVLFLTGFGVAGLAGRARGKSRQHTGK